MADKRANEFIQAQMQYQWVQAELILQISTTSPCQIRVEIIECNRHLCKTTCMVTRKSVSKKNDRRHELRTAL